MHTVEITLEQVLLARDRRVLRQRELAARYGGTLLSFTMNIAGPVKDAPLVRLAFQAGLAALDRDLGQPLHRELIQAPTGPEALLVYDRPAPWVKERCLLLEEREAVGLYLHIPFCRSKCDYCDFYSLAGKEGRMDD
mgnify:CR=1 FL=1